MSEVTTEEIPDPFVIESRQSLPPHTAFAPDMPVQRVSLVVNEGGEEKYIGSGEVTMQGTEMLLRCTVTNEKWKHIMFEHGGSYSVDFTNPFKGEANKALYIPPSTYNFPI